MNFIKVDTETFRKNFLKRKGTILLEFSYSYCSACQEVKDFILDKIEDESIKLMEIDIAKNQDLAAEYNVDKAPTLLLFKNSKLIASHIGYINQKELEQLLRQLSWWNRLKSKLLNLRKK